MRQIFCLIVSGLMVLNTMAQESYHFSLSDAKNYAKEHNTMVKNARLKIASGEYQLKETIAQGLPQVEAGIDYTNYFNYEIEFGMGGGDTNPPDIDYTKMDLGDMEVVKLLQGFMGSGEPTTILMDYSASAKIQISQLLFSGQYWVGIQTSRIANSLNKQSLQKTVLDVKELTATAYTLVLMTEKAIKIVEENVENLQKSLKQSEALLKAGMAEQSDIDQIKIALAGLKNTQNSMQRNLEMNYNMLRFQLGIASNDEIVLTEKLSDIAKDANNLLMNDFDYTTHIEYQMLETQEQMSSKMIRMEQAALLPTVAAFYNYNEKLKSTEFDMNPKHLIGLTLSWPLFTSGARNYKIQQSKISYEMASNSKQMVQEQLELQARQAKYDLRSAIENLKLQTENLELAANVYKSMERKHKQGVLSSLELTQANDNYLKAQNNYLSAEFDVVQSKLALQKLMGNI